MFEDLNPDRPAPVPPLTWGQVPPVEPTPADQASTVSDDPDDDAESTAAEDETAAELADWKADLRADFETWLASIEELPAPDDAPSTDSDDPDLYAFHAQLAAANADARKANRRSAEAISQWGDTLARFEGTLAPLRETVAVLAAAQPKDGRMARAHCLVLVELLDRMHRIARAFQSPPAKTSWWHGNDDAWRKAWETQSQGFSILVGHLEALLKKEGVSRIDTLGQPFDPAVMTAVAAEPDATRPPQSVLEELAAGYRRDGELLRPAQVKVSRQP